MKILATILMMIALPASVYAFDAGDVASAVGDAVGNFNMGIGYAGIKTFGFKPTTITGVVTATMKWLIGIVGSVAIIMFVVAGIMYMTSAGDETQAENAKKTARYALYGTIVALGSMVVLQAISVMLKGSPDF